VLSRLQIGAPTAPNPTLSLALRGTALAERVSSSYGRDDGVGGGATPVWFPWAATPWEPHRGSTVPAWGPRRPSFRAARRWKCLRLRQLGREDNLLSCLGSRDLDGRACGGEETVVTRALSEVKMRPSARLMRLITCEASQAAPCLSSAQTGEGRAFPSCDGA